MAEVPTSTSGIIVAKPSNDYRLRRYVLVLLIFCWGIWSIYDGFYRFPTENKAFTDDPKHQGMVLLPHPGLDVPLNQFFGVVMPPLALLYLGWVFYNSRGMYRFDGETVSIPGHPPIPVQAIRKIDRAKWDRKGIAYVHYQPAGKPKLAVFRLDDFIYDRLPTDSIFEQLEVMLEGDQTPVVAAPSAAPRQ
jgi:hypothetical protein